MKLYVDIPGASKTLKLVGSSPETSFFAKDRFFAKNPYAGFAQFVQLLWTCIKFLLHHM